MAGDRVWVIDDHPPLARCTEVVFSSEGYIVRIFEDPYKAAQALRDGGQAPDAVICDLFFSNGVMLDGVQFYSTMASQLARTAKFIYGGHGLEVSEEVLGGVKVIQKTSDINGLAEMVRAEIDKISSSDK